MKYDQAQMKARLGCLPEDARVAFAAACSMRLIPLYERYSAEVGTAAPRILREALDVAWNWVKGDRRAATTYDAWIDRLTTLLPDEDDAGDSPGSWAEDALASVIFTLKSIVEPDVRNVVWAAERAVNAASDLVRAGWEGQKGRVPTPAEGFADPTAATVLTFMERDLQQLEGMSPGGLATEADKLRIRAAAEPLVQP